MYPILYYHALDTTGLKTKVDKIIQALGAGDFVAADVKKMKPGPYYRAKLDDTNRLLFTLAQKDGTTHLLILEVIRNHNYDRSRFLAGTKIDSSRIQDIIPDENITEIKSTAANNTVHLLDKFIIFDDSQDSILSYHLPLIVIGSAGSGKTSVTLEKLKTLSGKLLYTSLSSYLVSHTRGIYYANRYENHEQEIDFLSFEEFLQTIEIPKGQEITANAFMQWFRQQVTSQHCKDGRKLFEEIRGVITGTTVSQPYLTETEYLGLGIKQSIYPQSIRQEIYAIFRKYLEFLSKDQYYDSNIVASKYQEKVIPCYDAVVVDEVQDFTNSQLSIILKSLALPGNFLLCGDANQIVHPNFFSWSKLKSFFYQGSNIDTQHITRILTKNYRNTPEVTELANRVLKLKNYRFGSIDKESHYLVDSATKTHGEVNSLAISKAVLKDINDRTAKSVHYAIIVLHEADKRQAIKVFNTPLIFTVQEAKGLEYENIILYNMVSADPSYHDIAKGVTLDYLQADFNYSRTKDKADKSLEIYKFYINALYVAITRAIKNVYLLESDPNHRFLALLQIHKIDQVTIANSQSSEEEWQKEASKLAEQGKTDQVKAIEEKVLQRKPVPWQVLDSVAYKTLRSLVLNKKTANKKEQIKLLNYAIIYDNLPLIKQLKAMNIKAANNLDKCLSIMQDEYFMDYRYRNDRAMCEKMKTYGIEFRNVFNMTPLMCAAYIGQDQHAKTIVDLGGSKDSMTDNRGRIPLLIALQQAHQQPKYLSNSLPKIYPILLPESLSLEIHQRLIKIDQHKAEFFIVLQLLVHIKAQNPSERKNLQLNFTAASLATNFNKFDVSILPEYRKRNAYISNMLSKNEISGNHKYNLRLFLRLKRGLYTLPKGTKIKWGTMWYDFL